TPTNGFTGNATIGYTISDGSGGTASALITVNVTNRPPVAVDDLVATSKNTPITFDPRVNDSDPDGDPLTIQSVNPTNGTGSILEIGRAACRETNDFSGSATIGNTISDGSGGTASAL